MSDLKFVCPKCGNEGPPDEIIVNARIARAVDIEAIEFQGAIRYHEYYDESVVLGADHSHYQCSYCDFKVPCEEGEIAQWMLENIPQEDDNV